ncbi:hypothetical protein CFP56_030280 [Quercus suber]|uniref:Uncharacterized protein n=1 Tax=Quercus suber TaxID=58331 RepID=A0AAW0JP14_QUESU
MRTCWPNKFAQSGDRIDMFKRNPVKAFGISFLSGHPMTLHGLLLFKGENPTLKENENPTLKENAEIT